ncbi:MAG: hypothetical protein RR201_03080 [Malacoplasma sp.]
MNKFKYIPGLRPLVRMAIYNTLNKEVFHSTCLDMNERFNININQDIDLNHAHIWSGGAYLVYEENTLEIINIVFSDFSNIIFLLRYVNKELWCNLSEDIYKIFESEKSKFLNEFELNK